MYLKSLYLRNFRNYKETEVHFDHGVNVFLGCNGHGKTNLLEAIYLIATGRSFRTQNLEELILQGEKFFFLQAEVIKEGMKHLIEMSFDGKNRKLKMDANVYISFNPLLGFLPCILYAPQDLELITGPPALRRRFLNFHLAQSDRHYVHHLSRFLRAMKQRNCLLKENCLKGIESWEMEMNVAAHYLVNARKGLIEHLQKNLAGEEKLKMDFQISQEENYLAQLSKNRSREILMGFTMAGPHRDDMEFLIDEMPAKTFASEGQKKCAMTNLRFAEWQRLTQKAGMRVLMAFDDFGLQLDEKREEEIAKRVQKLGQVFMTMPHMKEKAIVGKKIAICNGTII